MNFSNIEAVVMDMDGVLWTGDVALPGLVPFFDLLRARNLAFALATNNSGKSRTAYVQKLIKMGVLGVHEDQIITSGTATASYLQTRYAPGTPIHVLGGDGLRQVMAEAGFQVVDENARAVIVGLDPQFTYEKLKRATLLIRAGAEFIATNGDRTIPVPEGLAPGAGSLVAALCAATDQEPAVVIGKPGAPMFEAALRLLGTAPEHTLMIGDRLNTDIEGAARVGLKTALVLTGVSTRAEAESSANPPDGIYDDLVALAEAL
ncbi:MAG: HAD-IIA family hydrolase [Chloroflexota bacterium]